MTAFAFIGVGELAAALASGLGAAGGVDVTAGPGRVPAPAAPQRSVALLAAAGVEPLLTEAAMQRLRRLADLGLRDRFGGVRADDPADVLAAIEELSEPGAL